MKIGIIGAGFVGSTTAYTLALEGIAREIVLIDINNQRAEAEAADISHGIALKSSSRVCAGTYLDLQNAGVVIITADKAPGFKASRLELIDGNTAMFREIIPKIVEFAPDSIILIATTPVDVMTLVAFHLSGFPKGRVIGSGTVLDTARFRTILGRCLDISPQSVNGIVIGEHGDSALVSWSTATIGAMPLDEFIRQTGKVLDDMTKLGIAREVVQIAYDILHGKNATYYGIAGALTTICRAIAKDEKKVLTVSSFHQNIEGLRQVCLSLPSVVGRSGIIDSAMPSLSETELQELQRSAEILCEAQQKACPILKD